MSERDQMQRDLLARIESADLDALEAVRVTALGKQGSITALLKSLGKMSPDERQAEGPRIHALREAVKTAIATRTDALERVAPAPRPAAQQPHGRAAGRGQVCKDGYDSGGAVT